MITKIKRNKKKEKNFRDRLNKAQRNPGFGIDHIFKSGKYNNCTISFVIQNDVKYIQFLIRETGFKLNQLAFNYYLKKLKQFEEEKIRGKTKYYKYYDNFTNDDIFEDYFKDYGENFWYFNSNNTYNKNSRYKYNITSDHEKYRNILELPRDFKKKEIKKYYRKAALKWHPDKNNNSSESIYKMQKINNAYNYFKKEYNLD